MTQHDYFKMPAVQTDQESCVSHNGGPIPVPGRDIKVQGWHQGGVNVFEFTDPDNPVEIAFSDRGPVSNDALVVGGSWGAYWYNGNIYSSELSRGIDGSFCRASSSPPTSLRPPGSCRWRPTIRRVSRS